MTADGEGAEPEQGVLPSTAPVEAAILRFQRGRGQERDAAFRLIYETYFKAIGRFFGRRGVPAEECLDLTQETFLRIYQGLEAYEDRQRFVAWLYRVATTTHLKWLRGKAAAKRSAVEVSGDAPQGPEAQLATPGRQLEGLLAEERRQALAAAVAELPEQMRDCLTMRLYHQLAYREIAAAKRLSVETVKAHLFRARKRLEERLEGYGFEGMEL